MITKRLKIYMMKEIRRLYRNVDRYLNPPKFVGPIRRVPIRHRYEGDKIIKKHLESASNIKIWVIVAYILIAAVALHITSFLNMIK
jgi:hypothetical protein